MLSPRSIRPLDGGEAWFEIADGRAGVVRAVLGRAIYLEVGGAVVAVTASDVAPGPIHLRVDALPLTRVGAPVVFDRCTVTIGDALLDLRDVHRWQPPAVDAGALVAVARAAAERLDLADRSALARDPAVDGARAALIRGDVEAAVSGLAGRGVGLTPAGDDVLAGALVVSARAGGDGDHLALATAGARTHPVALAFLAWAARGQSVEPVHRLLGALTADDEPAVRRHQLEVAAVGHTSGADMLLGLRLGFSALA